MTTWLNDNSSDSNEMLNGKVEKNQVHWLIGNIVVMHKSFISLLRKQLFIFDFFIRPLGNSKLCHNISKYQSSEFIKSLNFTILVSIKMGETGIEVRSEWCSGAFFDSFKHP